MDKQDSVFLLVLIFFVGWVAGLATLHYLGVTDEMKEAIHQCESQLPRDKICEAVISAKVK